MTHGMKKGEGKTTQSHLEYPKVYHYETMKMDPQFQALKNLNASDRSENGNSSSFSNSFSISHLSMSQSNLAILRLNDREYTLNAKA